jgi:hypothetical protein
VQRRIVGSAAPALKQLVLSNLRRLEENRAGLLLQQYYGRWGELTEGERAHVFQIEAALDRVSSPGA